MREELKIPLTTICARLERAIHADVGMKGLDILIYGFRVKHGMLDAHAMNMRKRQTGYEYMTPLELYRFSLYAGYDLSK